MKLFENKTSDYFLEKYQKKLNVKPITLEDILKEFNEAVENGIGDIDIESIRVSGALKKRLTELGFTLRPFDKNGVSQLTISLF